MRVWGKLKIEDRIVSDVTMNADDFADALTVVCDYFDLTKPIVTGKHDAEIKNFYRTIFYPDDFIESVDFDTFEIEIIVNKKQG